MASKVYFTNFRCEGNENLLQKFRRLCETAGIGSIDMKDKYVAVKMHFGEPGNIAFLRHNYARALCDLIREHGGRPFLTDCNTLYIGRRSNALDHLDAAYENGFNPYSTGCHVIIGDGLKGDDEVAVPVHGDYVENAYIGRAVMDADIVISLTHFKAHDGTGFGGALKNLGMGCGSRLGKKDMHASEKPAVDQSRCVGCGVCAKNCAHGAITVTEHAHIDATKCAGCGRCIEKCPQKCVHPMDDRAHEILSRKVAEYTAAVVRGRPCFHVALACDISPYCDCYALNDAPILEDIGMFASFDPVAMDQCCVDMANARAIACCISAKSPARPITLPRCSPKPTGRLAWSRAKSWASAPANTRWRKWRKRGRRGRDEEGRYFLGAQESTKEGCVVT